MWIAKRSKTRCSLLMRIARSAPPSIIATIALLCGLLGMVLVLPGSARAADEQPTPEAAEFFESQVRPLLVKNCYECHGGKDNKGGLELTSRAAVLAGGDTGPAVVPGKPRESLLIKAVGYEDDTQMPPDGKLKDSEIVTLTRWVEMGLPWPNSAEVATKAPKATTAYQISDEQRAFWSFQPVRVEQPPAVKQANWVRSPIDAFVLARLEAAQLKPAPPADKRALLRRATFDLTGLPPTPGELEAFLADNSPEAYAKVIDRLLASPQYGERWGRHWLDVVRYADSRDARDMFGTTDIADAWRYRDWVVSALNRDLPYDRFIVDQVAGDIVADRQADAWGESRADHIVATGLLALGEWGTGDADKEKMLTDIVDDQINVVSKAFLGLTITCARCHDHKFDPIPTADYYSLAGIFYSTHILPTVGAKTGGSPMLRVPLLSPEQLAARGAAEARAAVLEKQLASAVQQQSDARFAALLKRTGDYLLAAWDYEHRPPDAAGQSLADFAAGRKLHPPTLQQCIDFFGLGESRPLGKSVRDVYGQVGVHDWQGDTSPPSLTLNTATQPIRHLTFELPPRSVSVHPGVKSGVAVAWRSPLNGSVRISGRVADGDAQCGNGIGWSITRRHNRSTQPLLSGAVANGGSQVLNAAPGGESLSNVEVHVGDELQLTIDPQGEYSCDTTAIEFEIAEQKAGGRTWNLTHDLLADPFGKEGGNPHSDSYGNRDTWRFIELIAAAQGRLGQVPAGSAVERWLAIAGGPGSDAEKRSQLEVAARELQAAIDAAPAAGPNARLYADLLSKTSPLRAAAGKEEFWLDADAQQSLAGLKNELAAAKKQLAEPAPTAQAALEGGVPQTVYEGFHNARIQVRGSYTRLGDEVPRRFPRIVAGDEQQPITEGSGRLQLANWLADPRNPLPARVMANRIWQHHFGAGIVRTPSNFGKLGERPTHPELLDYLADRFVKLNWSVKALHREIMLSSTYRQSSVPEPAALVKDADNRLFGRANRRRLEAEAIRDNLLAVSGKLDLTLGGPAMRDLASPRRTLYLMTVRSDRSNFRSLFDAADPETSTEARNVSIVAPQSLFLLNSPFVLDLTKALAAQFAQVGGPDLRAKVSQLYVRLYARPASSKEQDIGAAFLQNLSPAGSEPPLTAWIEYCQVLLCANEFVFID